MPSILASGECQGKFLSSPCSPVGPGFWAALGTAQLSSQGTPRDLLSPLCLGSRTAGEKIPTDSTFLTLQRFLPNCRIAEVGWNLLRSSTPTPCSSRVSWSRWSRVTSTWALDISTGDGCLQLPAWRFLHLLLLSQTRCGRFSGRKNLLQRGLGTAGGWDMKGTQPRTRPVAGLLAVVLRQL